MTCCDSIISDIIYGSCGAYVLYRLVADGASLAGGQVAVVAVGQVDANLLSSLHLELVHGFLSLGNIDPVVIGIAHCNSLLCFLRKDYTFRRKRFLSVVIVLPKL